MTEVLQVHDKLVMMKNCSTDEQRRRFLEMESASDKDAVEIAGMTVREKYHQNLIKQQDLRGLTALKRSSTV